MAVNPWGPQKFGGATSGQPISGGVGAPAAGATAAVGEAVHGLAREFRRIADKALTREGASDAVRVVQASRDFGQTPQLREERGIDDVAFNTVVRQSLLTDMSAEYSGMVRRAEADNPTDPAAFSAAAAAARAPFRERFQRDPELMVAFEREAALHDAGSLGRVRAGQAAQRRDISRAAFTNAASYGETVLGQTIADAGFDTPGVALVTTALNSQLERLVRFGPREAFEISGIQFDADPSRAGTMTATELAQSFDGLQVRTRTTWLVEAAKRAPDAATANALMGQIAEQWGAGNPAFAGLGAAEMSQIMARVEAVVERKATTEGSVRSAAASQLNDMLTAAEYGGDVDPERMRDLARLSGDPGLAAKVEFGLTNGWTVTPSSLANGGRDLGFNAWVNHLIDDLEGAAVVGNDNGAGSSQFGVTQRSHPEAWADGRVDRTEAVQIYRQYWRDIGGDNLPPALAAAAASFAVVAGVDASRSALGAAGGDLDRFYTAELAHYERLARDNPEKYAASLPGWRNRIEKSRQFAMRQTAIERATDGYNSDPIGYARGSGRRDPMADVPEFDINKIFGGDRQGAGQFLRDRLALGRQLNERSGVPVAIFDNAELASIKERIETDPAAIVELVTVAATTDGVGPSGARVMLRQLGVSGTATADLQLGWLSSIPTTRGIASKVIQGRALRAEGARDVQWPDAEASIASIVRDNAGAFALQPELNAVAISLASDMAVADQARGRLMSPFAYVNGALGATSMNGARYGGLVTVNGHATIAPTWLRADMMDEAVELAADLWARNEIGPRYSNGQLIPPREIRRYTLRVAPNGRYRMINRAGEELAGPNGRAFEFNIEALREQMHLKYPGSVIRERK